MYEATGADAAKTADTEAAKAADTEAAKTANAARGAGAPVRPSRARTTAAEVAAEATRLEREGRLGLCREFVQHGDVSVYEHVVAVAVESCRMADALARHGIAVDRPSLVRGALLHDYFLYDWHDKYSHEKLHGFHHPNVALENASREYQLTPRERDIIRKHMWPLTLFHIPCCREAWVVTTADKYCSLKETLLERKGRNKNRKKSENNDAEDTC